MPPHGRAHRPGWPSEEPVQEAERQIRLCQRNQCLLARSYAAADFTPVIDYVIADRATLLRYLEELRSLQVHLVTLAPGREVALARGRERAKDQRNLEAYAAPPSRSTGPILKSRWRWS